MDFQLGQDQLAIRSMVREFARKEIAPKALEWDEAQHFPRELFSKLGELGLLGVVIPEEFGGAGLGYIDYVTILEEIGAADGSIGLSVAAHNSLCTNHLYLFGSDDLKREYLPKLASGEWIGAWGLTEPQAGSDAGGVRTEANGFSMVPRHSSPTRPWVMPQCWWLEPPPKAAITGFPPSLFRSPDQGYRPARRKTSSGCGPPIRPHWCSKIAEFPKVISSAARATGSCRR